MWRLLGARVAVSGVFPWSRLTADLKRVLGLVLGETPGLLVSVSLT